MQVARFALRNLWRDLKSGELSVLLLALTVAVLSRTAAGFFTSRISQAARAQAAEILADHLTQTSPPAIFSATLSQLAALSALTASYPLRGHMRIADTPFGVARTTDRIPNRGEVWIDARIIAQLKISLGSLLRIGA